ncbi:MAG: ABC transporter permease [Clostridiales bacterium]|nr:ABC transporter permease [Clostridiales bacterium]
MLSNLTERWKKYSFLFEELVKRDFKKKYKRTILGMLWSMLGPMLQLLVMALIFTRFFGRTMQHYIIYLFAGNLVYSYFKESTNGGMQSLIANSGIITKINTPKYVFLLSRNVSALINFLLTLIIFFIFVAADGVAFHPRFLTLLYPIGCLLVFNIGVGLVLSALYVFFKDIQYLYDIFTLLLMYLSAIFYTVDSFPAMVQRLFLLNPVYAYIQYFRLVVLYESVPSLNIHLLCGFYALAVLVLGMMFYKRYDYKFLYYM